MDINCKNVENSILQGDSASVSQHIKNCKNCTKFLKTHQKLNSLIPATMSLSEKVKFNTIWEKSNSTKNITYLKWGSLLSAVAVIIMVIYLPISYLDYSNPIMNKHTYASLDTQIGGELESLDNDMFDIENNLTDVLINTELDDIRTSLNNFI